MEVVLDEEFQFVVEFVEARIACFESFLVELVEAINFLFESGCQ